MKREELVRMAREAGATVNNFNARFVMFWDDLERFADLIAAAERKRISAAASAECGCGLADEVNHLQEQLLRERERVIESEKAGWLYAIDKAVQAERNACLAICEDIEEDCEAAYKGRPPHDKKNPDKGSEHMAGMSDGACSCAYRIRRRGETAASARKPAVIVEQGYATRRQSEREA